jgi:hypothetical protein
MISLLEKRLFTLTQEDSSTLKPSVTSSHLIFSEAPVFALLQSDQIMHLIEKSVRFLLNKEEFLHGADVKQSSRSGVYFVARGIIDIFVRHRTEVVTSAFQGEVLGTWSCLSGEPMETHCIARTVAEVFWIPSECIFSLMNRVHRFSEDIWHFAALEVIEIHFPKFFAGLNEVQDLVMKSRFIKTEEEGQEHVLKYGGLMLRGVLESISERGSQEHKLAEEAPILLLPPEKVFTFSTGSLILEFAESGEWMYSRVIKRAISSRFQRKALFISKTGDAYQTSIISS